MELATMTRQLQVEGLEGQARMGSAGLVKEPVLQMNAAHWLDSGELFLIR